jgi:hypothetical protein
VREMPSENEVWKHTKLRSSKYLNNLIEQDHRGIKSRTGPMLGFKRFDYAAITIAGIELLRRIHKGRFALGSLRLKDQAALYLERCPRSIDQSFSKTSFCHRSYLHQSHFAGATTRHGGRIIAIQILSRA